jgi:pimeloyl-ACP methyl ester carboxylesterase
MGNSLGGAVAMQLLALRPQRVATRLADSAGLGSEIHPVVRLMAVPAMGRLALRALSGRPLLPPAPKKNRR